MIPGILKITLKSIKFYRRQVLYQILITALLCAVITGSLLTGSSVRASLKKSSRERLGNTGILISSGMRYFDRGLPEKVRKTGISCAGLLEIRGSSQGLLEQKSANNVNIYAVADDFFRFHNNSTVSLDSGTIVINQQLSERLGVREGDDLIIRFSEMSDIPSDAPFAPGAGEGISFVMKVGSVLGSEANGNFSLSISQIVPMNIFIGMWDIENAVGKKLKYNRLLIDNSENFTEAQVADLLGNVLEPEDAGLNIRVVSATGETELVSDRIFIDEGITELVKEKLPSSSPVITYLANTIRSGSGSSPYSFVSALPPSVYPEAPEGNGIIVNRWLSDDLDVTAGDSLILSWYSPDSLNDLVEKSRLFTIEKVVEMQGIWADSMLMPDFPGIAGSESCSAWDAGVPIRMDDIRDKDEDYWDKYKGTPKAFVNYETGKEIWGSNFGPATSIRFPAGISPDHVREQLSGTLAPRLTGFFVTGIYNESIAAAENSVDFGTLFLSLGFFLILASFVLLSFAVSYYFDQKIKEVNTLFALGFRNRTIRYMLFLESLLIGLIGCLSGAFAGYLVNMIITAALNSVWSGAVQTNTLSSSFDIVQVLAGFFVSMAAITIFMLVKAGRYLRRLGSGESERHIPASPRKNLFLLISFAVISASMFIFSLIVSNSTIVLSFLSGIMLLFTFILFWRQYYIISGLKDLPGDQRRLSHFYYSFYTSHAIAPVLFIAAGIFAFFITGVNRKDFTIMQNERSSGTGGYLLWCETSIPIKEDLNTLRGRRSLGLDEDSLSAMKFVQIKRSAGNDASCLNLNHITAPPLLGIDPEEFISREAFSFSKRLQDEKAENPWEFLSMNPGPNTIYGIADQTVLDWGLKLKVGDTLVLRAENGQPLSIIIAAGLQSSVFQGFVITDKENFMKYFPSVPGTSVFLVDGKQEFTGLYESTLNDRLSSYGAEIERTTNRLAAFYEVTNTYLSVFGVFGGLGMITGIAGLGFVILRNYNHRKREFALMLATGFSFRKIRRMVFSEQVMILFAGVVSGIIPAVIATLPSIRGARDVPWVYLSVMVLAISVTGLLAVFISLRAFSEESLITALKKE